MQKRLIVIGGPTASGKTALAIQLANYYNTEIISADSRQFYKELIIGTAKPTKEELNQAPHHFINSHSIKEHLNAGRFAIEANEILKNLFISKNVVILVGGSGLYINALINGLDNLPSVDEKHRIELKEEFKLNGINSILDELKKKDPEYFNKVDQQNHQRIIRALEIIRTSGKPYSYFLGKKKQNNNFEVNSYVIDFPREQLYNRINLRVDSMMNQGLLSEVESLINFRSHPTLQTVGYKEIFEYLDGKNPLPITIELIKQHTRNYAKRQLTWFKHQGDYKFLTADDFSNLSQEIINTLF